MITVKCISKNRNEKGVIVNYTLQDQNGQQKQFTAKQIKDGINAKQLEVINLQIDKAGRLVDKAEPKQQKSVKKDKPTMVHKSLTQQKERSPKDIVKDFLSKMDERYEDRCVDYRFTNDYEGTWIDVLNGNEQPMTPEVKKYFKTLIDCIEKQMRESSVYIYDLYEENVTDEEFLRNSKLPDKVVKFMQTTKCNKGIVKGLVSLAAESEGIAEISVVMADLVDDGTAPFTYTANYEEAKKHFKSSIEDWKWWTKDSLDLDREPTLQEVVAQIKVEGHIEGVSLFFYSNINKNNISKINKKKLNFWRTKWMQLEKKYTEIKGLVVGENDLQTWCKDHKEEGETLIKEWNQAKNDSMTRYKAGSDKVVYWKCSICNKEYKKSVRERVLGSIHGSCGRKRGKERLRQWHREQIKFENSLAGLFPELLKEWDYKKNKEIGFEPQYLSAYSSKRVHWICSKCKAKWVKEIRLRTAYGYGCKHCKKK